MNFSKILERPLRSSESPATGKTESVSQCLSSRDLECLAMGELCSWLSPLHGANRLSSTYSTLNKFRSLFSSRRLLDELLLSRDDCSKRAMTIVVNNTVSLYDNVNGDGMLIDFGYSVNRMDVPLKNVSVSRGIFEYVGYSHRMYTFPLGIHLQGRKNLGTKLVLALFVLT